MIQQVPTYMTTDGQKFDSLEAAEAHELTLKLDTDMDAIGEKHEINSRTMANLKKWVPVFIAELGYAKINAEADLDDAENVVSMEDHAEAA